MFLNDEELIQLTGRRMKSKQIEALKHMGIAFRINALGHAVVVRSNLEDKKEELQHRATWTPRVLKMS